MPTPWTPIPEQTPDWLKESGVGDYTFYDGAYAYDGTIDWNGTIDLYPPWTVIPEGTPGWTPIP